MLSEERIIGCDAAANACEGKTLCIVAEVVCVVAGGGIACGKLPKGGAGMNPGDWIGGDAGTG